MDNYTNNLECLRLVNPKLYQQIQEQVNKVTNDRLQIHSQTSRDGNLYLTVVRDGVEYRLNSNYRPFVEANRWSDQYKSMSDKKIVLMFGFGNGYFIRELLKRSSDNVHIIVVEPSFDIFRHVLNEYDIIDILHDKRMSLAIDDLDSSTLGVLFSQYVHWMNIGSQMTCIHPLYDKCFESECKYFLVRIQENNHLTLVNRNTEAFFGRDVVYNTIFNYKYITNSNCLLEIKDKITSDIPAIIVAAGPSLDLNIEELKRAKGKAVIFATDTALRYLYKHGIKADFVVTMDPKKPPSYFDDVDFENIPLFCNSEANREAICKHKGRKIWFRSHEFVTTLYRMLGRKQSIYNAGGSVATAAFSICKTFGFETIILIGQDLAYKGEVTHAQGDICKVRNEEAGICYVEGIDGKPIKSRHDWNIYRKWFENSIIETKDSGRVIDATEGGAMIHGTEIMTLKEAIDQYCHTAIDVTQIMEKIPVTFNDEELENIYRYLERAYEDVQIIPQKAEEIISLCKKGLNEVAKANRSGKLAQIGAQIVEKNNKISKEPVYTLIDSIIKHDVIADIQDICVTKQGDKNGFVETYESTKNIFISVENAAKEIEPLLKEAVEEFKQYVRSV